MQTKLKIHRDRVVIYYSYNKKIYRERTALLIQKKEREKVKNMLNKSSIPSSLTTEMGVVLERKAYCDLVLSNLSKKLKRIPTVEEFKKCLSKKPINLDQTLVIPLFEEHVNETEIRFKKGTNSMTSIKDYKSFCNLLKDYELENDLTLQYTDLNTEFVSGLFEFMRRKRKNTVKKQYRTIGLLNGRTIKKRFDNLKFFAKWLDRKFDTKIYNELKEAIGQFDLKKEELNQPIKRYALNKEGIVQLKSCIPNCKNEQIAKDIFLVSCFTSLRFSDLISLNRKHIFYNNEKYFIRKRAVKTSAMMEIPLKDDINKLINKYDYNLDRLSNAFLNKSLKKLLARNEYFNQESEYYKKDGSPFKLHEIISCHTGRRTLISRLLNELNTPPSVVMKLTGHTSIKSLNKYIRPDSSDLDMNLL